MGEELPMAREEEERRSVLLDSTGYGESTITSSSGDERTEETNASKSNYGRKTENTKTASKGGRKVKRAYASSTKRQRRRQYNQDRKSDRGDEGENGVPRRSAQELGIVYPGSFCDEDGTVPHHWKEIDNIDKGSLYQCKKCRRHLWLPLTSTDSIRLDALMEKHGVGEGYCHFLNGRRVAKVLMAKLQNLRRLEAEMADKRKFAKLADKILNDREYDRKEVSNGKGLSS